MQRTLVIVKPDGVRRRLVGEILARFERKGLEIVACRMMRIDTPLAERHYEIHKGRPFYPGLIRFMTSGAVVLAVVQGVAAVKVVRKMVGATFGPEAEPGTIRGDFGMSRAFNLIHASDSPETAEREVSLFFSPQEVLRSDPADERWIYDAEDLR